MESDDSIRAGIAHLDDLAPMKIEHGARFGATARRMTIVSGARGLGCTHYEVAPGKTAFPHHYHCGMEEALFILEGQGSLRLGDAHHEVRAGHWITLLPGPAHAHQLVNTGAGLLRYLCLSTQTAADVVVYPDSGKIAAMGSASLDFADPPWIRGIFRADATVGYYDGEDSST